MTPPVMSMASSGVTRPTHPYFTYQRTLNAPVAKPGPKWLPIHTAATPKNAGTAVFFCSIGFLAFVFRYFGRSAYSASKDILAATASCRPCDSATCLGC